MPETCDRCIQTAVYEAYLGMLGPILFCGHHIRANVDTLEAAGWDIYQYVLDVPAYVSV